jgi:hypothetical protein
MRSPPLVLLILALVTLDPAPSRSATPDSTATPERAVPDTTARDTTAPDTTRRIVREFPAMEVRGLLEDMRSTATVHPVAPEMIRRLPVDGFVDLLALQPGVVAQGEELHVRGGRAGETRVILDGTTLNEPQANRAMEVPLLALAGADLISGTPESRYAGATAGIIDLHTFDPGPRPGGEARWITDARTDTHFDRLAGRVASPLGVAGLGVMAAADATLDDTWFPALREPSRHALLGASLGWRAENRILGLVKLTPVAAPRRFSIQVLTSRQVHEPYDPAWSADGWVGFDPLTSLPVFSPVEQPGSLRYRAADHNVTSDERMLATTLTIASDAGARHGAVTLGWLRARTLTAPAGVRDPAVIVAPQYGNADPYHVILGDFPLFRRSGSDAFSLRGDVDRVTTRGNRVGFGAGVGYESVSLWELDAMLRNIPQFDAVRTYQAFAPSAFGYAQGRWRTGDMVVNAGLRTDWWTPGPQAGDQTFTASARGRVLVSPRLGLAFPLTPRDVVSMAYARVNQAPPRDVLYDDRVSITNRQPLGDAGIRPAVMISYEAALKRVLSPAWAFQTSLFYRDAARLAGAREYQVTGGRANLRYSDEDQASSAGIELSVFHAPDDRGRLEIHYTVMRAWGYESRPDGDPYGPTREIKSTPIGETPLSWDRRQTMGFLGTMRWKHWTWAWSSVVGAPLPWTPKPVREPVTDLTSINSRRFAWTETTNLAVQYAPRYALGLTFGVEARNLFDTRAERAITVDGYPNPTINTAYDDYGAYRTLTGEHGGAYWSTAGGVGHWVPVHDPRLSTPPRSLRVSIGRSW